MANASEYSRVKGAEIYCFMRSSGNDVNASWKAAYAFIKRQKSSLFKTSPEQASAMITEAVAESPGKFKPVHISPTVIFAAHTRFVWLLMNHKYKTINSLSKS